MKYNNEAKTIIFIFITIPAQKSVAILCKLYNRLPRRPNLSGVLVMTSILVGHCEQNIA